MIYILHAYGTCIIYTQVIYYIFHIEAVYEIYQTFPWNQSFTRSSQRNHFEIATAPN